MKGFGTFSWKTLLVVILLAGLGWKISERTPESEIHETVRDWRSPILVEAYGDRKGWKFRYSGPDGLFDTGDDVKAFRQLKIPEGAEVTVHLCSEDYVYVFSCPELDLKEIAVSELDFSVNFRSDHPGHFDLVMDPMCGFRLPPGQRMGSITVSSERKFKEWFSSQL